MTTALDAASQTAGSDEGLLAFLEVRSRLFGIAYRIVGRAAEAEDIVQDAWVRWQTADRSVVRDTAAFLSTTTTRLAFNLIQSARSRRESCAGPWLPELIDTNCELACGAEQMEALASAILVLLEKLSPTERAAYILREAFDYTYRRIADVLRLQEANARQLVSRARQHLATGRRTPASALQKDRLLAAFIAAARGGDFAVIESLLRHSSTPCPVLCRTRSTTSARINAARNIDHETGHHRRHGPDRIAHS